MNLQQIPNAIFKDLSFIKDLFLYGNKLTTLPSSISHLTNLKRLLLQQNWLTASGIPNEITKLTNLEQLDLRYNRLDGPLPTCICGLYNLEHLLLTYNKLTHIVDEIKYLKVSYSFHLLVFIECSLTISLKTNLMVYPVGLICDYGPHILSVSECCY